MKANKKKIFIILGIIIILILIGLVILSKYSNKKKCKNIIMENEIIPEEEISDEQLRETTIMLFFVNDNNEIASEIRTVDSKELLKDPYNKVATMLLSGPKTENLKSYIPENVKINGIQKKGETLIIDFSKEFVENQSDNVEIQGLVISQIVDTMTQLTEINSVKILIDGKENMAFKGGNIKFQQIFTKED